MDAGRHYYLDLFLRTQQQLASVSLPPLARPLLRLQAGTLLNCVQDPALGGKSADDILRAVNGRWSAAPYLGGSRVVFIINPLHVGFIGDVPGCASTPPLRSAPTPLHYGPLWEQEGPGKFVWAGLDKFVSDTAILACHVACGRVPSTSICHAIKHDATLDARAATTRYPTHWIVAPTAKLANVVNNVRLGNLRVAKAPERVFRVHITAAGNDASFVRTQVIGGLHFDESGVHLAVGARVRLLRQVPGADDRLGEVVGLADGAATVKLRTGTVVSVALVSRPATLDGGGGPCTVSSMTAQVQGRGE